MASDTQKNESSKRISEVKSISFDPYIVKKAEKLIESEEFGSFSGIVVTALIQFLTKYDLEARNKSAMDIIIEMLQTPEGKTAFEKINKNITLEKHKDSAGKNKPTYPYLEYVE